METGTTPESRARPRSRWDIERPYCGHCGLAMFYRPQVAAVICISCNPLPPDPISAYDDEACRRCGSKAFWKSKYNKTTCETCYPPAHERLVVERVIGYKKLDDEPVNPHARALVAETLDGSGARGVDRESLDLLTGDHEQTGRALMVCSQTRKLECRFRKGHETWFVRK